MRIRLPIVVGLSLLSPGCGKVAPPPPAPPAPAPAKTAPASGDLIRGEVIANILNQPLGPGTVADLGLPAPLVGRIADRVLRESFVESVHRIQSVGGAFEEPTAIVPPEERVAPPSVTHVRLPAPPEEMPTQRPGSRGFIGPRAAGKLRVPLEPTGGAAAVVASRLAHDGLLATLDAVVSGREGSPEALETELWAAGFPTDLLAYAEGARGTGSGRSSVVLDVIRHVAGSGTDGLRIVPRPTRPGLEACLESGPPAVAFRLQVTRGTDWRGVGDGGSFDLVRQITLLRPDAAFDLLMAPEISAPLVARLGAWRRDPDGVTVITAPVVVSQWAQDNGKPAWVGGADGPRRALLTPRYASRRDDGSEYVPGDSWIAARLDAAGIEVVHSPLLFQGGNVLVVEAPGAKGARWLLVGEAEIARNVALGLTAEEVAQAFAVEFGVDRVEVLENVAFHLDYDVTLRHDGDELVAFVTDPVAASEIIVSAGAATLVELEALSPGEGQRIEQALNAGDHATVARVLAPATAMLRTADGALRADVTPSFSIGQVDTGAGNLQRFMLAIDILSATTSATTPVSPGAHPQVAAYLAAQRRAIDGLYAIGARLEAIGCRVVRVPGLAEGRFGVCPVNGIHDGRRYYMPAWGGWMAPLDDAAAVTFQREMPQVTIERVLSAETQQRGGAVHCAISAWTEAQ